MKQTLVLLGTYLVATTPTAYGSGWCVLNGAEAVNDLMDAGVYSWAASKRCNMTSVDAGNVVKCEVDVASAAESVNRMVNVIAVAVNKCNSDDLKKDHTPCGIAAGKLTAHFAGLAAASGSVVQQCPNPIQQSQHWVTRDQLRDNGAGLPLNDPSWPQGEQATCAVDLKDSMNQVFQASNSIAEAEKHCDEHGVCAYDALDVISAFAGLGKFLLGAIGHCYKGPLPLKGFPLTCSEHITNFVRQITGFIADSDEVSQRCHHKDAPSPAPPTTSLLPAHKVAVPEEVVMVPVGKLYAKEKRQSHSSQEMSLIPDTRTALMAVSLPVAGVASFLFGMRRARSEYRGMELVTEADVI